MTRKEAEALIRTAWKAVDEVRRSFSASSQTWKREVAQDCERAGQHCSDALDTIRKR